MLKEEVERRAFEYFSSGYNCAESTFITIIEYYSDKLDKNIIKMASGLGGGIGGCQEEVCGALSGGIMAIGYLFGRNEPGDNIDQARSYATEFRMRFLKALGSTKCKDILESLGEQENYIKCKKMTATMAGILFELLNDKSAKKIFPS